MEVLKRICSGNVIVLVAMALLLLPLLLGCREHARDSTEIRDLMQATWNRPDAVVMVDPIAVSGEHAVADWTQGKMGGRALLARANGKWRILLCAGDALKNEKLLQQSGVPASDSRKIAHELVRLEAGVPAERLAAMSAFKGLVRMENGHP